MWKSFRGVQLTNRYVRTFLSDAYRCTDEWKERLNKQLMQKIEVDSFMHTLTRKSKVCAIDVDILSNKVEQTDRLPELTPLLKNLRSCEEASKTLPSTSYALIRGYLDFGVDELEDLINILEDRLTFGIFLDNHSANLLLDTFLIEQNYRLAARIASLQMLQEDFEHEITRVLSLYACYKYAQKPVPFVATAELETTPSQEASDDVKEPVKKRKKKQQAAPDTRVRVSYIRLPYFDDHFDLTNSEHLVGKTLLMIGRKLDGTIGNSAQLIGYSLYQKYEDGNKFLENIKESVEIHRDAIELAKNVASKVQGMDDDVHFKAFIETLNSVSTNSKANSDNLEQVVYALVEKAVRNNEQADIDEQKKIFATWIKTREEKLLEELHRLQRTDRLQVIDQITQEMEVKEKLLWFFENEDQINVAIHANEEILNAIPPAKRNKDKNELEEYIPPQINKRRT